MKTYSIIKKMKAINPREKKRLFFRIFVDSVPKLRQISKLFFAQSTILRNIDTNKNIPGTGTGHVK
jgi:hypothetical protein